MQNQNNIPGDIDQVRYQTINRHENHEADQRKQQAKKYGNSRQLSDNSSQRSYEKDIIVKDINRRETINLILNYTTNMNNFLKQNENLRRRLTQF